MSNMSYCRFQNTAPDFTDCVDNLRSLRPTDRSANTEVEREARAELIRAAANLLAELGIENPEDSHAIVAAIDALDLEPAYDLGEEDEDYAA